MKKITRIFITLIAVMLLVSVFSSVALATGNGDDAKENKDEKKAEQQEKKDEREAERQARKDEFAEKKAAFEERKLERNEIRTATKAQLQEQKEIIAQHKQELKNFMATLQGMTDEERALYKDEIDALRLQIKEAQKYCLQIRAEGFEQIREIFPGVKASGLPTEEEVEDTVEEVLGDL